MTRKAYKPFNAITIGTTVSCYTLEKMLNGIGNIHLNQRVTGIITRFFSMVRKLSLSIHDAETRKIVGKLLLEHVENKQYDIKCPEKMIYVIRNIKYAYIKDMMIADVPMNYERKLRPHEIEDYYDKLAEEFT